MTTLIPWFVPVSPPRAARLAWARRLLAGPAPPAPEAVRAARVLAAAAGPADLALLQRALAARRELRRALEPLVHEAAAIGLTRDCRLRPLAITVPTGFAPARAPEEIARLRRRLDRLARRLGRRGLQVRTVRRLPLELRAAVLAEVLRRIGTRRLPAGLKLWLTVCPGHCAACFQLPYCDQPGALLARDGD